MSEIHFKPSSSSHFAKPRSEVDETKKVLIDFAEHLPEVLPFSGVLSITVGNDLIVHRAYCPIGTAFNEEQTFNVFSTGKLFTAVAAMQLVEEGRLNLDDSINTYLSEDEMDLLLDPPYLSDKPNSKDLEKLKKNAAKITVRQLLEHQSGLTQTPEGPPERFFEKIPENITKPYSNYGYQLLAVIIGKQTQNSKAIGPVERFREHIEQRVFYPSGMKIRTESIPSPYSIDRDGQLIDIEVRENEPYSHGNGCWKLTSKDLLAFGKAIQEDVLIRKESLNEMLNSNPSLGFDIDRDKEGNIQGFGHPGGSSYGTAFLYTFIHKKTPVMVSVLSNCPTGMDIKPMIERVL